MNDEIIGTAILNERHTPAVLHVVCHPKSKKDGHKFPITIPVKLAKDPDPAPAVSHGWGKPWSIEIHGDKLTVRPSFKVFYPAVPAHNGRPAQPERELFHNGGVWTVKFVRWHAGLDPDGYHALKQVNPGLRYE